MLAWLHFMGSVCLKKWSPNPSR